MSNIWKGENVTLRRAGSNVKGLCPFHSEKTPSFTVYPADNSFYCFGCGEGGDIIRFYQLYYSYNSRHEACQALEKELGINIEDEDIQRELLKEGLNSLLNTEQQQLDYNSVNLICSKMCREYLNYVRNNYKHLISGFKINANGEYFYLGNIMNDRFVVDSYLYGNDNLDKHFEHINLSL